MPLPSALYETAASAPPVPRGLPLVITLTGFADAGGAVGRLVEYVRDELEPTPLTVFSNDVLLDYRARRPIISFDHDHLTGYRPPRLELSLAHDALGQPFLSLAGYEPDFAWDAFSHAVVALADDLGVSTVTWVHAIPMPVPHTRPIGATVSGTRTELTRAHSVWQPQTQVPANIGHLLEYRFAESGAAVAGFALLVPHYLADTDYPAAALAGLDSLTAATGLAFSGDTLRGENREYLEKVDDQVGGSDELSRMLQGLEERYDSYMAGSTRATPMIHTGDLPSADELAAELERFLATRPSGDDEKRP
ncbi:proteasome assembly chaperone family protein [Microbacterium fluvii]|uniref:Proteasome assembly chaperone family protein n=1 Tax=Microbacterium fluvii TaxID=415215 RepID=A0ABW2HCX6_9MICO|nr:PAC2 family protein [Microbacterium fluvii]MCU4671958.1 PAC2 family protein [Microbacterium fluvii]